jgi:TPR repeat protein
MQAERDALRDFVLPQVNEFAAKYGRAVEIIDLRWGVDTAAVTEEEQNHKVLRTCLDEIERSRPFFLGLIGDRYGWTPSRRDMEAALESADFSLKDPNMSVTALEIEYGVLRSENPPVCLFYFRESPDYAAMPEEIRPIYQDEAKNLTKLAKLKEKIQARFGQDIKEYTAEIHENGFVISKDWANMVAMDIMAKLREEWGEPSETPPDWKEQERDMQEAFRESRTAHFAGRAAAIADMTAFCVGGETTSRLCMLKGEAGSGKSGLLCKVMDEIEDQCLLLPFSCGISSRSSLVENMLRYFIFLLCEKLALEDDSEDIIKFQDLKNRFMELLFDACAKTRVVAVVDALDQLAGSDESRRMLWISGRLPENFRLLCSIIDGPEIEAVKQFGGEVRPMPLVNKEDEEAIIHGVAARHHKQISSTVVEHILRKQTPYGAQSAQNPLYLSLITQDLVMMDRYELETVQKYMEDGISQPEALAKFMRERIDKTPGDPEGAYLAILSRMEKLIGQDFVREVCGMIAISRSGLRESDLKGAFIELKKISLVNRLIEKLINKIFGNNFAQSLSILTGILRDIKASKGSDVNSKRPGTKFNPADFSWLRQMMRGHISQGDMQQWDFSHQSLRRAIRKKMPKELERLNNGIVAYFLKVMVMVQDDFPVREIMHHLCSANKPDSAAYIMSMCGKNYKSVLARGLAEAYIDHENGKSFLLAIPASIEKVKYMQHWQVAEIICKSLTYLPEDTRPFRIELLLVTLAMLKGKENDQIKRVTALCENDIAFLYTETGETEKAGEYYRKSLNVREQQYEQSNTTEKLEDLSESYCYMGIYLESKGRTEEAGVYFKKAVDASETLSSQRKNATAFRLLFYSYYQMGGYLTRQGRIEEAGICYQKCLEAGENHSNRIRSTSNSRMLAIAYGAMGGHLVIKGLIEEADTYIKKGFELMQKRYEQLGGADELQDLATSCFSMGDNLIKLGKNEEAELYYRKSLDLNELFYEQRQTIQALSRLETSYNKLGFGLMKRGQSEEAKTYYQKSIEACEKIYAQSKTISALKNLSQSYRDMGNCLRAIGQKEEAGIYYQKSLKAYEEVYKQSGTKDALHSLAAAHGNIGRHFMDLGQIEAVEAHYRKSINIFEELNEQMGTANVQRDLAESYNRMGGYLAKSERWEEAGLFYQKSLGICEKLFEQSNTTVALNNLISSYKSMGELLEKSGKKDEANYWYTKAAEHGDAKEHNRLGFNYATGKGVEKDLAKANYWFNKAAEQGYADAQCNLGINYARGNGIEQDWEKANYWYAKAAEQGNANAQCNLGINYAKGNGVEQDWEKANYWYAKAAEQGSANAQCNLGINNARGNGVEQNWEKANYWYAKAAEQGNIDAQNRLGINYADGRGVEQDYEKANYWFNKAAEQGNATAQNFLGISYANGNGVEQDFEKANYWFAKAAEQGNAKAQCNLGISYAKGNGVTKDIKMARHWFALAAGQGNKKAKEELDKLDTE